MKKLTTILLAVAMAATLVFIGCADDSGKTTQPESVAITNTQTTLQAGDYTLTAEVKPAGASQAVTWTLLGSPAGISLDGNKLTIAETAQNELKFRVKVSVQTDPTINDTKEFTVDNPPADAIEISTEAELRAIVLTANYKLVNDITLTEDWEPLGEKPDDDNGIPGAGLAGTLDGNGYTIKNFNMPGTGYNKGMFYVIESTGVVKNLGIESGKGEEDGVFGNAWCGVIAGKNDGTIQNCYTDVQVTMSGVPGGAFLGTNNGIIENSYAIGVVNAGEGAHGAAFVNANNGTINQSFVLETSVVAAVGWNKAQNPNIQKSENWMQTAQNYKDAGWDEDIWSLVDGYYPQLKYEGYVAPAPKAVLNITNTEEYLDYNEEDQRTLQINYTLSNVTNNAVTYTLKSPVTGVSISNTGLVTLTELVADGAKFTVVVTSVEVNTLSVEKTFIVNHANLEEVVEISTFEALKALAASTNPSDMAKKYRMTADIDASEGWFNDAIAPNTGVDADEVAYATTPFTGVFDGNGYTISGWKGGDGKGNMGLFGEIGVGGVVKNLTITIGAQNRYYGAGSAAVAGVNRGTIINVVVDGPGQVMGAETNWVAGIAFHNFGTIKNCIMMAKVSNDGTPRTVAGIACNNHTAGGGTIENCFVDTTVTGITQALNGADETLDAACIKTTEQLKTASLYAQFDTDIWNITEGEYPTLKKGLVLPSVVKITTEAQLRAIGADIQSLAGKYILMNDIVLTEEVAESGNYWTSPIGTTTTPFTGVFDGNGYTISNVKNATAQRNFGFFGVVSGTVKNLCIDTNGRLVTGGNSGVFVGTLNEGGVVENCMTKGEIRGEETRYATGFVYKNNGTIRNCIAIVVISHTEAGRNRGGFAVSTSGTGTFEKCMFDITVAGSSDDSATSQGDVKFYPSSSAANPENSVKTTTELKTAATYDDSWSSDVWNITEGEYPALINGCSESAAA